jgi:hypothetical protein
MSEQKIINPCGFCRKVEAVEGTKFCENCDYNKTEQQLCGCYIRGSGRICRNLVNVQGDDHSYWVTRPCDECKVNPNAIQQNFEKISKIRGFWRAQAYWPWRSKETRIEQQEKSYNLKELLEEKDEYLASRCEKQIKPYKNVCKMCILSFVNSEHLIKRGRARDEKISGIELFSQMSEQAYQYFLNQISFPSQDINCDMCDLCYTDGARYIYVKDGQNSYRMSRSHRFFTYYFRDHGMIYQPRKILEGFTSLTFLPIGLSIDIKHIEKNIKSRVEKLRKHAKKDIHEANKFNKIVDIGITSGKFFAESEVFGTRVEMNSREEVLRELFMNAKKIFSRHFQEYNDSMTLNYPYYLNNDVEITKEEEEIELNIPKIKNEVGFNVNAMFNDEYFSNWGYLDEITVLDTLKYYNIYHQFCDIFGIVLRTKDETELNLFAGDEPLTFEDISRGNPSNLELFINGQPEDISIYC